MISLDVVEINFFIFEFCFFRLLTDWENRWYVKQLWNKLFLVDLNSWLIVRNVFKKKDFFYHLHILSRLHTAADIRLSCNALSPFSWKSSILGVLDRQTHCYWPILVKQQPKSFFFFYMLTNAALKKKRMPSPVIPASHSGSNVQPTRSAILGSAAARKSPFSEESVFGVVPLFTRGAGADDFKMASRWWQRLDCGRGGFCVPPTPAVQLL